MSFFKSHHRAKIAGSIVVGLGTLLVILYLILPLLVKNYLNGRLENLPEYRGHVESVSLELLQGAFRLHDFTMEKLNHKVRTPFVSIASTDFSLRWRELFHGKIVTKIGLTKPVVNFVDGPTPETSQAKVPPSWQHTVRTLVPFRLDLLWIRDGNVHFRNFQSKPVVDLYLENISASATGLTNETVKTKDSVGHVKSEFPGAVKFAAKVMKTGKLKIEARLDVLAEPLAAETKINVQNIQMQDLNSFFLAYGKFDVQSGEFNLDGEARTQNGKLVGFVKPFMVQPIVLGNSDKKKEIEKEGVEKPNPIWEALIASAVAIFKNHPHDLEAAKVPFHGDLDNVKVDVWSTVWSILSNAFIKPLK